MAEKRKKLPQFVTPKGTFRFPKLSEPDYGNEKFPKPDGEYSVQLLLPADSDEAKALIEKLTPMYEAALDEAKEAFKGLPIKSRKDFEKKGIKGPLPNSLFSEVYDKETEEPTGEITFKFAMRAGGTYKQGPKKGKQWSRKPVIVDAKGKPMRKCPGIWGGTIGKISFEAGPYFIEGTAAAGLRLALQGVQIIDLVTAGERSAASLGFGEEDGYEHEDAPAEEAAADAGEDATADAGDF
jgi:hypothetical protein